ncbi:MAG: amidase, partial [Actinobacteria bacterium]|nr:amidase [Actinomycetota bacterium]
FDTAGLVTTYGSVIFADHVPTTTAEAVRRLEAAGYANVGKTNLHEFAYGVTSENPHFGTVPNPAFPGRIAGGSSGGSAAAVAAGLAEAALGSDSGGSIRIPAACCGIVGFKPSYGLVPAEGCFPLAPTFDHVGPMARAVAGCSAMMEALAPGLELEQVTALDDVTVAVAWLEAAEPLVARRIRDVSRSFRRLRTVDIPIPGVGAVFMREVAGVHRELFAEHADRYGPDVRSKIERCLEVTDEEVEAGEQARASFRAEVLERLQGVDLLLTPTLGFVAPPSPANDLDVRNAMTRFTLPWNALGWPALALPCGAAEYGLPASVQIAGRHGADGLVLAVGHLLEQALAAR